jgi:hypothetical protein
MFKTQKETAFAMTECNQSRFDCEAHFTQKVVADFEGGTLTSDGGALLLRQTDRRIGLLKRLAACFSDHRRQDRVEHPVETLVAQRVYALALGYEDLNDHDQLRSDPLLAVLAGQRDCTGKQRKRARDQGHALAGKSTLNRLESTAEKGAAQDRYKKISYSATAIDDLLVTIFQEAHLRAPKRIVLDLDATDSPLHGCQQDRFFHGYYGHYCYLPLYIFSGEHLLCARLRPSNIDAAAGSLEEVERIVTQIRQRWPKVGITLRADSGFCRDELMSWCENNDVDYVFGLARNDRLRELIEPQVEEAAAEHARTGEAARVFTEFRYRTRTSWHRESPLRGDLTVRRAVAGPPTIRETLLRPRRHGEPHQGAAQPVQRAVEHSHDACQSTATVSLLDGLRAGASSPAVGAQRHRHGPGADRHHPSTTAEDRRPGADQRAPGVDLDGQRIPLPGSVWPRLGQSPLLMIFRP